MFSNVSPEAQKCRSFVINRRHFEEFDVMCCVAILVTASSTYKMIITSFLLKKGT